MIQPRLQAGKGLRGDWRKSRVKVSLLWVIAAILRKSCVFCCHFGGRHAAWLRGLERFARFAGVTRVHKGMSARDTALRRKGRDVKIWAAVWVAGALLAGLPAAAQDRVVLGWGGLATNDAMGDGHDRWHTGGYQVSMMHGVRFQGALPKEIGALLEFRALAQILAPANLSAAGPLDRRYAGLFSLGAHTQFDWRGSEVSFGGDLVMTGPQTGLGDLQKWIHRSKGLPEPLAVSDQIGNGIYPTFVAEIGQGLALGDHVTLRPFAQAQVGVESFLRAGGDVVIGSLGRRAVMVRDAVSGQRYPVVKSMQDEGLSLILGADLARIFDSVLLPQSGAARMSDERQRLRVGAQWQGEKAYVFYGVSYLGSEFASQAEGQLVGALDLSLKF